MGSVDANALRNVFCAVVKGARVSALHAAKKPCLKRHCASMVFTPARARGDRSACVSEPPPSNDTGLHWRDQIDRCEAREAWFTRRALTRGLPRARAVSRHRAALSLQVTDGGPACARVVRASLSISTSRQRSFSALHMVLDQVASSPTRRLQGGSAGVVVCNASRVEAFHG